MKNIDTTGLKKKIERATNIKSFVMKKAYTYFLAQTPVRLGYARRQTKLVKDVIECNYPYAEVLDKGRHQTPKGMRGSEQAPKGMTAPTVEKFGEWVEQYIKRGK